MVMMLMYIRQSIILYNLPDFRGRVFGGIGTGPSLTTRNMGASTGAETHTLDTTQIPAHNHTEVSAGAHSHTGATGSESAHTHSGTTTNNGVHTHTYSDSSFNQNVNSWCGGCGAIGAYVGYSNWTGGILTGSSGDHNHTMTTNGGTAHTHTISSDGAHTHTINNTGGGLAHNNMQPTLFGGNVYIYSGV